jgi:hypothetical protein
LKVLLELVVRVSLDAVPSANTYQQEQSADDEQIAYQEHRRERLAHPPFPVHMQFVCVALVHTPPFAGHCSQSSQL